MSIYLSFWQVNKLKEFSAPKKFSSSSISTAVIQFGLESRAICNAKHLNLIKLVRKNVLSHYSLNFSMRFLSTYNPNI